MKSAIKLLRRKAMEMSEQQIIAGLNYVKGWNEFAASLVTQWYRSGGHLTDRQWLAGERMLAKLEANKQRAETMSVDVSVGKIEDLLNTAMGNGMKRPVFRAKGLSLSFAGANSVNAGAVYVKAGGEYQGKIMGGKFMPARACEDDTSEKLLAIAADPRGSAIDYGRETGQCACCGRTLTNAESIDLGIGPVCAEKWGL
jgi:hypothetical protein